MLKEMQIDRFHSFKWKIISYLGTDFCNNLTLCLVSISIIYTQDDLFKSIHLNYDHTKKHFELNDFYNCAYNFTFVA